MIRKNIYQATKILRNWKGDSGAFGEDVLDEAGRYAVQFGKKAIVIVTLRGPPWNEKSFNRVKESL